MVRAYSYHSDGRLLGLSTKNGSSDIRQSLTFGYNGADEITGITNAVNATLNQQFAFDGASRLGSVVANGGDQAFGYDADGNRTSHTWGGQTDGYTVDAASNRLDAVTGSRGRSFTLDDNGNVIASGTATFGYDAFNRGAVKKSRGDLRQGRGRMIALEDRKASAEHIHANVLAVAFSRGGNDDGESECPSFIPYFASGAWSREVVEGLVNAPKLRENVELG